MKKNLITALKKLVTSFGGEGKSNNAVELVDEFADVAAQGGGGSGGGVLICTDTEGTLDKTMGEILEAMDSGKNIYVDDAELRHLVVLCQPLTYNSKNQTYEIAIFIIDPIDGGTLWTYGVSEATEEAALSAYPSFV